MPVTEVRGAHISEVLCAARDVGLSKQSVRHIRAALHRVFDDLWRDEVALVFSYAASGEDLSRALELIRSGQVAVEQMISHRLPLAQAPRGFALTAAAAESLKVILLP